MTNPSPSPSTNKWRDFPRRLITGLIGVPAVLLLVYVGGWAATAAIVVISLIAALEIARVIDRDNRRGLVFTLVLALIGNALAVVGLLWLFLLIVGGMALAARALQRTQVLYFVLGAAYVAIPLSMLIRIRAPQDGLWWLLLLLLCVWGTDTFALIGGRLIGQRKLAPSISPGKTVEGAVVGAVFGFLGGMLTFAISHSPWVLAMLQLPPLPWWPVLGMSLLLPWLAIGGDLFESWVKRFFHVKDSGQMLPGHGGFLDRIDGILFAAPFLYALVVVLH
jgi:phosphatidate cytidylyltransferase